MNFTINQTVHAPIDTVFKVFSDFSNATERIDGIENIEILTEGQVGKGTRFRETRIMFGREATEEMEITEFEPNKKYVVEADSCGAHCRSLFRFQPDGDSTNVEVEFQFRPMTLFAKLMSPLGFFMAGSMKKCLVSDIDQLKQFCEKS